MPGHEQMDRSGRSLSSGLRDGVAGQTKKFEMPLRPALTTLIFVVLSDTIAKRPADAG